MKVLLLADGRAVHTVRYQKEMKAQGVELILASMESGDTVDIRLTKKSVSNSLNYLFVNREIKQLVSELNPDLVNPHFASAYGFSTALSKIWQKLPVLLHCLGSDILLSPQKSVAHKRKVIYALEKSKHVMADSKYLADEIRLLHQPAAVDIVPWGVEQKILDLFSVRQKNSFQFHRPLRILVPRPHNKIYNNRFIIDALHDLINSQKISLTFPSWGEELIRFKKRAKAICPNDGIMYYNRMDRHRYIIFLANFDVYLSASLSDSAPASLIEAMASGLVPVVGEIPGVKEWVGKNNARLFDPQVERTLNRVMKKMVQANFEFDSILKSNHEKVRKKAVFSVGIGKTIKIMEKMIRHGRE